MNENMIETMKRIQDDIFNLNDISLLFDEKLLNGLDIIKGYLENIY